MAAKAYGVGLLVETIRMIIAFSTSIIGGIYATLVAKPGLILLKFAEWSVYCSVASIFIGLMFLFYVAERNIKGTEPHRAAAVWLIGACWFLFLLGVGFAAKFAFQVAKHAV